MQDQGGAQSATSEIIEKGDSENDEVDGKESSSQEHPDESSSALAAKESE